jgi:hypothetical protein
MKDKVTLAVKTMFTRILISSFQNSLGEEYTQRPLSAIKPFSAIAASSNKTFEGTF